MKKSEMLMKCKELLWDGVSEYKGKIDFICLALLRAVGSSHAEPLRNIISERLEGYFSLRDWLCYECKIPYAQLTDEALQKHRHQWVDLLIKEFEAKGD